MTVSHAMQSFLVWLLPLRERNQYESVCGLYVLSSYN